MIKDKGKDLKDKVIDFIDSNNATTLIGTVDFEKFTKIRNPDEPYFICDGKELNLLKSVEEINNINKLLIMDPDDSEIAKAETAAEAEKAVAEKAAVEKATLEAEPKPKPKPNGMRVYR